MPDSHNGDKGDRPVTEFVRLPTRNADAAPKPVEPAGPAAQEPWRPPGDRPPAAPRDYGHQAPQADAPFGGFHSRPSTAMIRVRESRSRMWGVLAVLVGILVLGLGAFALARPDLFGLGERPGPKEPEAPPDREVTHDGPREAPPGPTDTGTAPEEATDPKAAPTGATKSTSSKSTSTKTSTTKPGSEPKPTGTTTKKTLSGGKTTK